VGNCAWGKLSAATFWCGLAAAILLTAPYTAAGAWVYMPDYGDSGWQTYTYTAGPAGFNGQAGFVVSNVIDNYAYPELLLDNLSHGGGGVNRGFEAGNYTNYTLTGSSYGEVTAAAVTAYGGNIYRPTQGDNMSHQLGLSNGAATSAFRNAFNEPGTVGSILETAVTLPPGTQFSFDWAFLANDAAPWRDFSRFYLKDAAGNIIFTEGLGQVGTAPAPTPLPSSLVLLGTALLAAMALRGRAVRAKAGRHTKLPL